MLAEHLGIGVGSTRSIIDQLVREGRAITSRRGTELTPDGKAYFDKLGIVTACLGGSGTECAALIRGKGQQIDDSVLLGLDDGQIRRLRMMDGILLSPDGPVSEQEREGLISALAPVDGDAIIVADSHSWQRSEELAVTKALSIVDPSVPCWEGGGVEEDQESVDLRCFTLIVHELMGRLPVTMRYRNRPGVRCERGEIIDDNYTGPVLEEALAKNSIVRRVAQSGTYRGVPIVAVPVMKRGEAIAVIGVVDITKGAVFDVMRRMKPG